MMSRCFTWFPFWWIRRTQYIPEFGGFYKNMGILLDGIIGGLLFLIKGCEKK